MNSTQSVSARQNKGYIQLIAAGEPYRLLFPIGALIGIFGVMMWPLFVWIRRKLSPSKLAADGSQA